MPWQLDGTFLRVNPDYSATPSGELWGQDLAAIPSIKIIASRHDYHDQDLGDGIAACLNLDGLNAMRAALDMGGHGINNVQPAVISVNVPLYGQCAGAMTFAADVLTLLDRDGGTIDTVSIPTGGGGTGTVSSVSVDSTLESSPNPIVTSGTIGMKYLAPGQTYSGGISSIQIDNYGRVIQVTEGAFANTNITIGYSGIGVEVKSSTGSSDWIYPATSSLAGVMTPQDLAQISSNTDRITVLEGEIGGGMKPPIVLTGINHTRVANLFAEVSDWVVADIITNNEPVVATWDDTYTITGSGIVEFLGVELRSMNSPTYNTDIRIVIDGIVVWTGDDIWTSDTQVGEGISLIGAVDALLGGSVGQVKFDSSFTIQTQHGGNNLSTSFFSYIRYQKDSN